MGDRTGAVLMRKVEGKVALLHSSQISIRCSTHPFFIALWEPFHVPFNYCRR